MRVHENGSFTHLDVFDNVQFSTLYQIREVRPIQDKAALLGSLGMSTPDSPPPFANFSYISKDRDQLTRGSPLPVGVLYLRMIFRSLYMTPLWLTT